MCAPGRWRLRRCPAGRPRHAQQKKKKLEQEQREVQVQVQEHKKQEKQQEPAASGHVARVSGPAALVLALALLSALVVAQARAPIPRAPIAACLTVAALALAARCCLAATAARTHRAPSDLTHANGHPRPHPHPPSDTDTSSLILTTSSTSVPANPIATVTATVSGVSVLFNLYSATGRGNFSTPGAPSGAHGDGDAADDDGDTTRPAIHHTPRTTPQPMLAVHDQATHTVRGVGVGDGLEQQQHQHHLQQQESDEAKGVGGSKDGSVGGGGGGSGNGGGGGNSSGLVALVVSATLLSATLGLITCVVSHYRGGGGGSAPPSAPAPASVTGRHRAPYTAADPTTGHCNTPIAAPMLSVVSASAAAGVGVAAATVGGMDGGGGVGGSAGTRLHRHVSVSRELAAQRDRQVRLHSVHTDLELDLPPSIALPDGEEIPYGSSARLHIRDPDQESEIYQKCIRPPPNRTVFESESPPPYRSSSAGLLGSLGGSSSSGSGSGSGSGASDWSGGSTPLVVRCHSMSSTSKRSETGSTGQKTDFLQRTVKIFTGKKTSQSAAVVPSTVPSTAPTLPVVIVPTRPRRIGEQVPAPAPAPSRTKPGNV